MWIISLTDILKMLCVWNSTVTSLNGSNNDQISYLKLYLCPAHAGPLPSFDFI